MPVGSGDLLGSNLSDKSIIATPSSGCGGNTIKWLRLHWANVHLAIVAHIVFVSGARSLQYRTLLLVKTVGTKIVQWLAALVLRLERINKNAVCKLTKLIASCLCIPTLVFHQLAFKLIFNLGQLILLGLCQPDAVVQIKNGSLQLDNLLLRLGILDEVKYACGCFNRLIHGGQHCCNGGEGHKSVRLLPNEKS